MIVAFIGLAIANEDAAILKLEQDVNAEGFQIKLELDNHVHREEVGDVHGSKGSFGWVAPDGTKVELSYVADENGYQPQSDLLPTSPPIPEAIARSLEYNRAHPAKPEH